MVIAGKKVFVTGGGVRVGAAIVRAYAAKGARLVIHCNNSRNEAEELLESIGGREKGHTLFAFDLTDKNFREEGKNFASLKECLAECDVLINNASCYYRKDLFQESMQEISLQFEVNFFAPVFLMKLFAENAKDGASIVNILDQGIFKTDPKAFSYALSKKALAEATKSAALTFAPRIRVNAVAPGPMIPPVDMPFSTMEKSISSIPLKKAVAPEDVASSCVFLSENSSMTGAILTADGGLSLA